MPQADISRFIAQGLRASERALICLAAGNHIDRNDLIGGALALDQLAVATENASACVNIAADLRDLAMRRKLRTPLQEREAAQKLAILIAVIARQVAARTGVEYRLEVWLTKGRRA